MCIIIYQFSYFIFYNFKLIRFFVHILQLNVQTNTSVLLYKKNLLQASCLRRGTCPTAEILTFWKFSAKFFLNDHVTTFLRTFITEIRNAKKFFSKYCAVHDVLSNNVKYCAAVWILCYTSLHKQLVDLIFLVRVWFNFTAKFEQKNPPKFKTGIEY